MKKIFLIGLAALFFASCLFLFSCGDGSEGGSNAFVGTWVSSTFSINVLSAGPATVKFSGSGWTLTVPSEAINESGQYTVTTSSSAGSVAKLTQNGVELGTALVVEGTLRFQLHSNGLLDGFFTKQ